jgi:hypothetical protein
VGGELPIFPAASGDSGCPVLAYSGVLPSCHLRFLLRVCGEGGGGGRRRRRGRRRALLRGDQQDFRWFICSLCCFPVLAIAVSPSVAISWSLVSLSARLLAFSDFSPKFASLALRSSPRGDSFFAAGSVSNPNQISTTILLRFVSFLAAYYSNPSIHGSIRFFFFSA